MKKIQTMHVGLAQQNGFGSSTIAAGFVVAGERQSNIVHMREKSVINMI
jgi:hypothetical protein